MLELEVGKDGGGIQWGTDGHDVSFETLAGVAGAAKRYSEVKQEYKTAQEELQRLLAESLVEEIVREVTKEDNTEQQPENPIEEAGEILDRASEEALAEDKIRIEEENLSDTDFDGTIGKNPQEYDYNGTIGREEIELAADTHIEKPYAGAVIELIGKYDTHTELYGDDDIRGLYFDFNNEGRGFDLEFGTGTGKTPSLEFEVVGVEFETHGEFKTLTGSVETHADKNGLGAEAGIYTYKYTHVLNINKNDRNVTIGGSVYWGGVGFGLKLGSKSIIRLPGFGVDVFGEYNKKSGGSR